VKIFRRGIAATELLLIFPAALFMAALFLRNVQPDEYQPAHTAQLIVRWFTQGPVWLVLWVLLMALPLAVLVIGGQRCYTVGKARGSCDMPPGRCLGLRDPIWQRC
jgi:hypothetical protein